MFDDPAATRDPHDVEFGELPELTRALRALGSARRSAGPLQTNFFRPLLDARRSAQEARTPEARVRAFDATRLRAGLHACLDRIVAEWPDTRESARRAIRAQLAERLHGYEDALERLQEAASAVLAADEASRLAAWRAWTARLQAAFRCADESWVALQSVANRLPARPRG